MATSTARMGTLLSEPIQNLSTPLGHRCKSSKNRRFACLCGRHLDRTSMTAVASGRTQHGDAGSGFYLNRSSQLARNRFHRACA